MDVHPGVMNVYVEYIASASSFFTVKPSVSSNRLGKYRLCKLSKMKESETPCQNLWFLVHLSSPNIRTFHCDCHHRRISKREFPILLLLSYST